MGSSDKLKSPPEEPLLWDMHHYRPLLQPHDDVKSTENLAIQKSQQVSHDDSIT